MDMLATLRARLGIDFGGTLAYVTGGGALAHVKNTWNFANRIGVSGAGQNTDWLWGWTVGGGIERMLGRGWSGKAEFLWVRLDDKDVAGNVSGYGVSTPAS